MRLTLQKEVLVFAILITVGATAKAAVDNQYPNPQNDIAYSNVIPLTASDTANENQIDATNSVESKIIEEIVNSSVLPSSETTVPNTDTTITQDTAIITVNEADNAQERLTGYYDRVEKEIVVQETQLVERSATGYFNQVEKSITDQDSQPTSFALDKDIKYRLTLFGLIFFLSSTFVIFGVIVLAFSSLYYRIHLKQNKCAPFEAPDALRLLFPKPINYEYEINNLCTKYLDN